MGRRNNAKFIIRHRINRLSREVIRFKILPIINIDLEDLVFGMTERKKTMTDDILYGWTYIKKVEKEIYKGWTHIPLIFIQILEYLKETPGPRMEL